jgi:hypothetical protein
MMTPTKGCIDGFPRERETSSHLPPIIHQTARADDAGAGCPAFFLDPPPFLPQTEQSSSHPHSPPRKEHPCSTPQRC